MVKKYMMKKRSLTENSYKFLKNVFRNMVTKIIK